MDIMSAYSSMALSDKSGGLLLLSLLRTHRVPFETMGSSKLSSSREIEFMFPGFKIILFVTIIGTVIMFNHDVFSRIIPRHFL